jgi:hypothetical protein
MTEELKNCPFCGGRAELNSRKNIGHDNAQWWVHCAIPTCYSIGPKCLGPESAVLIWNNRRTPSLSEPSQTEAALREALEKIEEMVSNGEPVHYADVWDTAKDALVPSPHRSNRRNQMTQEEANIQATRAGIEQTKAQTRLCNAQAFEIEQRNKQAK